MSSPHFGPFTWYEVNPASKYYLPTKWDKQIDVAGVTKLKVYVNNTDCFEARNLNIFTNYTLTFFNAGLISKWVNKCDMSFYQNQLNFAVWCATSGSGVSMEHLASPENLMASVFRFHVYYQTRKILEELSCPIPGDQIFNATDNHINLMRYQKLCNEFDVGSSTDFRFKGGDNSGLGSMYSYKTNTGYYPWKGYQYNPKKFQFGVKTDLNRTNIDYVKQDAAIEGWKQFILDISKGFTRAGAVRLDDSIRNYVYCILGAQAQTRSNILTSLETQQYFVDLLEENIKSMFSIPESIAKYQDAVTKTNSRIDYVIAFGLYMISSDMVLKVGTLEGYNNSIIIATKGMLLGKNEQVNQVQLTRFVETTASVDDVSSTIPPTPANTSQVHPPYLSLGVSIIVLMLLYVIS